MPEITEELRLSCDATEDTKQGIVNKIWKWIDGLWKADEETIDPGDSYLRFWDTERSQYVDLSLIIDTDENPDAPLLAISQGVIVKKDFAAGGFLSSNQGALALGSGLNDFDDVPKIWLIHSELPARHDIEESEDIPSSPDVDQAFVYTGQTQGNWVQNHLYRWNGTLWSDLGHKTEWDWTFDTLHLTKANGETPAHLDLGDLTAHGYVYVNDLSPISGQDWIDVHSKLRINGDLQLVNGHVVSSLNPSGSVGLGSPTEPWDGVVALNGYFDALYFSKLNPDVKLYRSAPDVLKTDDSLHVGGNLTVDGTMPTWDGGTVTNDITISKNAPTLIFNDTSGSTYNYAIKYDDNRLRFTWGGGTLISIHADGSLIFGDEAHQDTKLYRSDVGTFYVEDHLIVEDYLWCSQLAVDASGIGSAGNITITKASPKLVLYADTVSNPEIDFYDNSVHKMALFYASSSDILAVRDVSGSKDILYLTHGGLLQLVQSGSSAGLRIGSDCNIYRDTTETLRLQNNLIVDQYLYVGADLLVTDSVIAGSTGNNNMSMYWTGGHAYLTAHTGYLYLTSDGGRIYCNDDLYIGTKRLYQDGSYLRSASPFVTDSYLTVGVLSSGSTPCYLDGFNRISTYSSSIKYKENVKDLENTEWVYDLRPVTFDWKDKERQKREGNRIGLIAEEVFEIVPNLVWLKDGIPDGVNYEWLAVPMLVELKKLRDRIADLRSQIELLNGGEGKVD